VERSKARRVCLRSKSRMALYSHVVTDEPVVAGGMVPHLYSLGRSTETFVQKWRNANPVRPVQNRERPLCARRETGRNRPQPAGRHIHPKRSLTRPIYPSQPDGHGGRRKIGGVPGWGRLSSAVNAVALQSLQGNGLRLMEPRPLCCSRNHWPGE
jgi:hypothetical protein